MQTLKISNRGPKRGELLIYGEIGESMFGDGISAKDVSSALKAFGALETLTVRLNSPGGDVFDAFAMFNLLRSNPATIDMKIDGFALSAGSVVAMAGDSIDMAENAMMMIHNAWSVGAGDAGEHRALAEALEKVDRNIARTYAERSGGKVADFEVLMGAETWLNADEARALGLADNVTEPLGIAARVQPERYRNAPPDLVSGRRGPRVVSSSSEYRLRSIRQGLRLKTT